MTDPRYQAHLRRQRRIERTVILLTWCVAITVAAALFGFALWLGIVWVMVSCGA